MTVTKQQQLEWMAEKCESWPIFTNSVKLSDHTLGAPAIDTDYSTYILITREEWQQKRDELMKQQEVEQDNSWYERGEFPPAGCECDFCNSADEWTDWCRSVFVGFDSMGNGVVSVFGDDKGTLWISNKPSDFHPLRTEREKAIDELNTLVGDIEKYPTWKDAITAIIDAGYHKD